MPSILISFAQIVNLVHDISGLILCKRTSTRTPAVRYGSRTNCHKLLPQQYRCPLCNMSTRTHGGNVTWTSRTKCIGYVVCVMWKQVSLAAARRHSIRRIVQNRARNKKGNYCYPACVVGTLDLKRTGNISLAQLHHE